eukprot:6153268-Alexandrium_andersonii.AAC.1
MAPKGGKKQASEAPKPKEPKASKPKGQERRSGGGAGGKASSSAAASTRMARQEHENSMQRFRYMMQKEKAEVRADYKARSGKPNTLPISKPIQWLTGLLEGLGGQWK